MLWISEGEKRKTLLITCNEILVIIIILPYLKICPHDYKKTLQPIHTKLSEGV